MKKSTLFFATYLALNCSITNADTLAHFHNAREHSHSLPSNGIAHRHNGGKVGTVNGKSNLKNSTPRQKITNKNQIKDQNGCIHYNPNPSPNESITWTGDCINGYGNGNGRITWSDGNIYEGNWVNGKSHGKGKFTWGNGIYKGDVYVGDYVNGKRYGKGKYTKSNGDIHVGDYVNGKRYGKGKYTWGSGKHKGDVYEGDWVNNKKHGKGKYIWSNGDVYVGNWVDDERTGKTNVEKSIMRQGPQLLYGH